MNDYRETVNLIGDDTVKGYLDGLDAVNIPAYARHEPDGSWTVFVCEQPDPA